jgi:hypothetical protein
MALFPAEARVISAKYAEIKSFNVRRRPSLLARRLPHPHRLQGFYAVLVAMTIAATVLFGIYSGVAGIIF